MVAPLRTWARLGRECTRLGWDLVAPSRTLPRAAADLDAATLSQLIGASITGCEPVSGTSGTTDRTVFRLTGTGVPPQVFVKSSAIDLGTRIFGGLARLGEVEVGFYRDLRPTLAIEAPVILGCQFDRRSGRFVIVLEDLAGRGAEFVDTRTPLNPDQVAAALSTLAGLHGSTTGRPDLPNWLSTNSEDALLPLVAAVLGRLGRRVESRDPTLAATGADGLLRSYRQWAGDLDRDAFCVLHGDPHPGNMYLLGDRVGMLDWQAVRRGHGLRDAAYALVLSLDIDVRREVERDLLAHYCQVLGASGGPQIGRDAVWAAYRRMVAYIYVSTTFTSGLGGLQGEEIADTGLRRAVAAVEDLETVEAIGRSGQA